MWEKGWGQRCVLHTVYEVNTWEMHENEKVICSSARRFVSRRCTDVADVADGTKEPVEVLCDEVETVKGFCYLRDRLNASGGCETAVTSRVRIG